MSNHSSLTLANAVDAALKAYFAELNGERPTKLHQMVIFEVEKTLFKNVMELTQGNQSQAAKMLGINRNTLRAKLNKFDAL